MFIDWSAACTAAQTRPLDTSLLTVQATGYSLVAAFAVTSCASAVLLFLYERLDLSSRGLFWSHFPRFLSCCCAGCAVGFAAWSARTESIAFDLAAVAPYPPPDNSTLNLLTSPSSPCDILFYSDYNTSSLPLLLLNHRLNMKSQGDVWNAVFFVLYPVELLLLTAAKGAFPFPSSSSSSSLSPSSLLCSPRPRALASSQAPHRPAISHKSSFIFLVSTLMFAVLLRLLHELP